MGRWTRVLLLAVCVFWLLSAALADTPSGVFSEELDTDLYDCTLAVTPPVKTSSTSAVRLDLESGDTREYTRISITNQLISVDLVNRRKKTPYGQVKIDLHSGTPAHFTILRRGAWLALLQEQTIIFRGEVPRLPGTQASIEVDRGWSVDEPHVQRLEPVAFSDNFMRTTDEPGNWTTQRGEWALQSAWDRDPKGNANRFANIIYSQNPFAWSGRSAQGSALCTAGKAFWEDYTMNVALCAGADGAAGVMVNMPDTTSGYLVRWSPANDRRADGDRIALFKVADGKSTLLCEERGGYVPEQWYKLSIISTLNGLQVLVDDQPRLTAKDVTPWRGGVGLYTEGKNGAIFDDVTVYGHTLKKDIIAENQLSRINQRYQDDHNGMQEWAARSEWLPFPGSPSQLVHRWEFFGDHWMVLNVRPFNSKTGELWLALNGDGKTPTAGYRAVMKLEDGKLTYTLYRDTTALVTKSSKPLATNVDYSFRFWHEGNKLWLEQDGVKMLEATDAQPLTGLHPAYRAEGSFAMARDVMVLGRNVLDYTFADEPVDWIEQGTWMETTRWSCAPHWSFLAGWSRGDAVLWQKKRITGDQSFDAFVGLKMEYPRERDIYDNRYRDFGIAICSDGHDPRSGYAGVFGAADETGKTSNQRTVLIRNGVVVASANITAPGRSTAHREWFELELHKRGSVIELWVEGRPALTYTDPNPLDGGVPAIWTNDNGMSVALARLHFANPAQPRTDAQVIIDEPWYPEWSNVNTPLTLNFPETWSTSGQSVTLKTTTRLSPAGDEGAVTVQNTHLTYTPKKTGEHWFEVSASDGTHHSPSFHLTGMTFDPALGRDDSHALLLYRFNEGAGDVVHDQSKIGPPADLTIKDAATTWLSGQGIVLRGVTPMMTKNGVAKLKAIAKSKACTIECWISTDTIYPSTGWSGCIMSWETKPDQRNFAIGQITTGMIFAPRYAQLLGNDAAAFMMGGFRTGLQHYVLTWDGTSTRWYMNGKMLGEKKIEWEADNWAEDYPLLLGNQSDGQRTYLGAYYLVAIHDRCLSDADVQRHYQAGPSAK